MDLKELLGEELYQQVSEKAGSHKLAVVNDGQWFPKEKFDQVNNDNKELKDQLKERDGQLKDLGKKAQGNDDLQQQIKDLQQKNKDTADEYQAKLDAQSFDYALSDALRNAKARNPKAIKALLDTEAIKLDGDKLLGLEKQLKGLQESDAYLFEVEQAPQGPKGRTPNPGGKGEPGLITRDQFNNMNYTERAQLYNDNPDLYKKLNN
ncbi:phage scaffolding protein [Terribacillus saccharophilus]|uniref:Scaffolding protein n=1 Tax=Terribacillus saccharophilus TaxID=361277 RepID=A0ABX4H0V1_9BACI|nr:phage scaffolding protein [Terribacillus saccharophilus]PAD36331.1 scaffolding protein [Terribacillus saccharophilus]PAD95027.1 scaffolding protein [Terribacillus saccharophilus]PAE00750.1 scaffolding protein [Terribacillus saccharophilus]